MGKKILLAVALIVFCVVGASQLVRAQSVKSGSLVVVPKDQTVDSMLFSYGRSLEIAGTVNGDVICAGMNVTISGTVHGDVICAAQTIHISGHVEGGVRVAGQNVSVDGQVDGSASLLGQTITTSETSKISKDLTAAGSDISINGQIGRDVGLAADNATVNGQVGRNLNGRFNSLKLDGNSSVDGNLDYTSAQEASIADGAKVAGSKTRHQPVTKAKHQNTWKLRFAGQGYAFISLLVLALVLVLLFPQFFHEASERTYRHPGRTALIGFLSLLAAPFLFIALLLTLIGVPLALLFGLTWLVILMLSGTVFSYSVGRLLMKHSKQPVLIMFVGAAVVLVLYALPILSFITLLAAGLMGTGSIVSELFIRTPKPRHSISN